MLLASCVWLALAVVFGLVEAMGPALVSIWFCVGAAAAFVVSLFTGNLWVQVVVFVAVSAVALACLRPLIRKVTTVKADDVKTNYDTYVGREVVVEQAVPAGEDSTGRVRLGDVSWLARTADGTPVAEGVRVVVKEVDSAVLVVAPV
jgi:membrane protein implicated in regulation of membrane protease activity